MDSVVRTLTEQVAAVPVVVQRGNATVRRIEKTSPRRQTIKKRCDPDYTHCWMPNSLLLGRRIDMTDGENVVAHRGDST
ncbi:MAG: hypothetical protein ACJAZO_001651 [Myxococcota bacterium]|jgi:hypothetical protein